MQSSANSISEYLKEVPEESNGTLKKLRQLCRATLSGFEESTQYSGPTDSRNGEVEVCLASQKNFIGLYILRTDVMEAHRELLKCNGIIRSSGLEKIDFKVLEMMLKATVESTGAIC